MAKSKPPASDVKRPGIVAGPLIAQAHRPQNGSMGEQRYELLIHGRQDQNGARRGNDLFLPR